MANQFLWDDEFKELNSINISHTQKKKMWQNIRIKAKRGNSFQNIKNLFIVTAALALFIILTTSLINVNHDNKNHSATQPKKHLTTKSTIDQAQKIIKNDSNDWEVVSRLRYDLGVIKNIQIKQNEVMITIKRMNTFGSDADPLGQVINPDSDTRTYILRTSENKQVLHLKVNQNILLSFGQYEQKNSPNTFWAAEVLGYMQKGSMLYNPEGQPLNLIISSAVKVTDGTLYINQ